MSEAVLSALPSYTLSWHANADAMVWAILDHGGHSEMMPRFTICRLDRCLVVMIETGSAARQFCSVLTMDDAVDIASGIARELSAPGTAGTFSAVVAVPVRLQ